jgi:hypothetical protein
MPRPEMNNTQCAPSRQCLCGCGHAIFPFHEGKDIPAVCADVWRRVDVLERTAIVSEFATAHEKNRAKRFVYELAERIRASREDGNFGWRVPMNRDLASLDLKQPK